MDWKSNLSFLSPQKKYVGWIACAFLIAAVGFSKVFIRFSNNWTQPILSTINHSVWSMILVWMILASVSEHRGKSNIICITYIKEFRKFWLKLKIPFQLLRNPSTHLLKTMENLLRNYFCCDFIIKLLNYNNVISFK